MNDTPPPYIDDPELRDTAPDELKPQRDTQPPGSDAIDDPAHADLLARMETSLDQRFEDMRKHLSNTLAKERGKDRETMEKLLEAVQRLANEKTEVHELARMVEILQRDIEALKARCPQCSVPPQGDRFSVRPGE